jgi:hypothetical protein
MNADERNRIYERLQALQSVDIDHALERGKDYLVERLMDCRRRQDEVGQLAVRVKRALFAAKIARRAAWAAAKLSSRPGDLVTHQQAEDAYDEMKALEESVGVCRSTLRVTDSDIRLAATLLGMQIVLGQPGTPVESETVQPVVQTPVEAVPTGPPPVVDAIEDLFGAATTEGHVFTTTPAASNGTVAPGRPPSATVTVDATDVIDFDALLA